MYKNIKFGTSFQGQTTSFKIRFAEERPNFIRELEKHCYWLDQYKTVYRGKTYHCVVGSFHCSVNNIFNQSLRRAKATKMIDLGWSLLEQANAM